MRLDDALAHFKTTKKGLAEIAGVVPSAVQNWNPVIPLDKAALLSKRSFGALRVDWDCYDEKGKPRKADA